MPPWVMDRWWDLNKVHCFYSFTTLFSLRSAGAQNIPPRGPCLVLANHQSFLDPVLMGLAVPRYTRFVHRETLGKNKFLKWVMNSLRGIPIDQVGFSREGLQATLDALAAGGCVAVFPEGERTFTGELGPFKPGISLLVKRSRVPIIPAAIMGAFEAFPRMNKYPKFAPLFMPPSERTIAVSIGRPIDPEKYQKMPREEMLEDLRKAVLVQMEKAEALRRKRRTS